MKRFALPYLKHFITIGCLLISSYRLNAQNITSDPGAYMTAIANAETDMNHAYLTYMSAIAHSGRARKVEKMRQKTLQSIEACKAKITALPYFKGDNSLRKSNIDYIDMCYRVFNDDYAHIVNMEDIVEQSYDEMHMYILLMEKTDEKLQDAIHAVDSAGKGFAAKYQVQLIDENDKLSQEMATTSKVLDYRSNLYLLFYKCNWEDGQITKAINSKELMGLEQSRNALDRYAKEGLLALDSLNSFQGDHSLAETCSQALQFYQTLAESELPDITNFFLKEENFDKIKKAFAAKPHRSLTQQDIDTYNKAVNDYNAGINAYNELNAKINNQRSQYITNWSNADKSFLDAHIPHVGS